jgi:Icc-related predicted phosphoesterase
MNTDGAPVMCKNGTAVEYHGLKIVGISGIWAKSHAKPWYITDEEVKAAAIDAEKSNIDIFVTHGCAVGLNDIMFGNRRGGQRCFLDAFEILHPRVYLCGHLHCKQMRQMRDGRYAINVGQTSKGDYACVTHNNGVWDAYVGTLKISEESS